MLTSIQNLKIPQPIRLPGRSPNRTPYFAAAEPRPQPATPQPTQQGRFKKLWNKHRKEVYTGIGFHSSIASAALFLSVTKIGLLALLSLPFFALSMVCAFKAGMFDNIRQNQQ